MEFNEHPTIIGLAGDAGAGKSTLARLLIAEGNERATRLECCAGIQWTKASMAEPLKELGIRLFRLDREDCYGPSDYRKRYVAGSALAEYWADTKRLAWNARGELAKYYPRDPMFAVALLYERIEELRLDAMPQDGGPACGVTVRKVLEVLGTDWGRRLNPDVWVERFIDGPKWRVVDDIRFPNEVAAVQAAGGVCYWLDARERVPPKPAGYVRHASEPTRESLGIDTNHVVFTNGTTVLPMIQRVMLSGGRTHWGPYPV
jgi:hypothetical protein